MGKLVTVKITEASKFSMMGQPVDEAVMPGLVEPLQTGVVSGIQTEKLVRSKFPLAVAIVIVSVILRVLWMFL